MPEVLGVVRVEVAVRHRGRHGGGGAPVPAAAAADPGAYVPRLPGRAAVIPIPSIVLLFLLLPVLLRSPLINHLLLVDREGLFIVFQSRHQVQAAPGDDEDLHSEQGVTLVELDCELARLLLLLLPASLPRSIPSSR